MKGSLWPWGGWLVTEALLQPSLRDDHNLAMQPLMERLSSLDLTPLLVYLLDLVHPSALPCLAEQFHVLGLEGWSLVSTDADRRSLLKQAIELHRHKGTPWAIKSALAAVGWPGLELTEGLPSVFHDGTNHHNGSLRYEPGGRWAMFRVSQPIPGRAVNLNDLATIRSAVREWAPARCVLESIRFRVDLQTELAFEAGRYDALTPRDGRWRHEGPILDRVAWLGVGRDGITYRRRVDQVEREPGLARVWWSLDTTEANEAGINTFALFTEAGATVANQTRELITKTEDLTLEGLWTLSLAQEATE